MELAQLIEDCRHERRSAQKALYGHFARPFFGLCRRYLKNESEAEEVLQNGFVNIFAALPRFEYISEAATVGWMKRVLVNECLQHLRRSTSFLQVGLEEAAEVPGGEDPLEGLEAAELLRTILQLPTGYRTVFNLYVLEQYSHKEIAALLGISEGTSKSQLSKARALLQQLITQAYPGHGLRKTR
ncbi:sigma-70 family RNA polymerase sigma factor [Flaviaesturariibacter amylovorans]|uniref:Sigma-70 family RNA polymerase sigma factor n=1 Tax=Flaviaesturariibacter amylovorans TaxID=1084520 RepID=A0ABP8HEG3_9BACT